MELGGGADTRRPEENMTDNILPPDKTPKDVFREFDRALRMFGVTAKTMAVIGKANQIIDQYNVPLTVRQIYYRFVGEGLIENSLKSYKRIASILARGREESIIPYEKIVDRTREASVVTSWSSPKSFFETVKTAYRKDMLEQQENYVEVWVEKDALAGLFEPVCDYYGVTLVSGRGYPSHSALYEASKRFRRTKKDAYVFYFGDFDPSGEDIYRDLQDRMENLFDVVPSFKKVSLTYDEIRIYNLPPAPAKKTDSRFRNFVRDNGNLAVELDALPPNVLVSKIRNSIEGVLDMELFEKDRQIEAEDRLLIEETISRVYA